MEHSAILYRYFSAFTPRQVQQWELLGDVYKEWNEKINVISRKDIDSLYERHILHSLSIAAVYPFEPGMEVIDIGTGGGFPGIPLAIFFPDVQFLLADSIAKKLKVVEAVVAATGLTNVQTRHTRAEDIRDKKFDFAVSRAVAPLKELWKWSRPLLKTTRFSATAAHKSGLICLKGGDLAQEIQESGTRPYITEITDLFPEEIFRDKYMLYVPR